MRLQDINKRLREIKRIKSEIATKVIRPFIADAIHSKIKGISKVTRTRINQTIKNNKSTNAIEIMGAGGRNSFSMTSFRYTRTSNKQGVGIITLDNTKSFPILADSKRPHVTRRKFGKMARTNYKAFVIKKFSNQVFKAEMSSTKYKRRFIKIKRTNSTVIRNVKTAVLTRLAYANSAAIYTKHPDIKTKLIDKYKKELQGRIIK